MSKEKDSVRVSPLLKGVLAEKMKAEKKDRLVSYSTIVKDALRKYFKG